MAQQLHGKLIHRNRWHSRILGGLVAVVLAACGGGDSTTDSPLATMQPTTVIGADGASMDFTPAEGLLPATLSITRAGAEVPALPPGMEAAGTAYQFAPLGHVGSAVEIRVPFDGAQSSAGVPRLLVTLPQEGSWSEVDAQVDGATLRARVPALGYAVAARPLSAARSEHQAASSSQHAQYLRGQLSAEPPLQGSGFLLTASAPSTARIRLDYSFGQSCAVPVQLRLRALVVRSPSSTQPFSVRTVDLGSRALTARAGGESFEWPLTAAHNGTWVFLADARCIESGRVRFGVLTALPVLLVRIVDAPPPPPAEGSATLGAAGGVVDGPDGVKLIVPAGTVGAAVTFRIARSSEGAPELLGLNAVSPVYAVTPHGQAFDGSARLSIPLSAAQLLPAGAKPLLLKAEPGGTWRIMQNVSDDPSRLAVDIDGLSYYVVGSCTSTSPAWTIGAVDCPGVDHQLELRLYTGPDGSERILVGTGVNAPAWYVNDTPQTLFMNAFWKRPAGTNRTDQLAVVGSPGGFNSTGFRSTWTNEVVNVGPEFGSYGKFFDVTIDPAQVPLANTANGRTLRVRSYASYSTTAFRIGVGPVAVGFQFQVDFPIRVSYSGTQPTISQQPANVGVTEGQPASFAVQASIAPTAALTYQWSRRADTNAAFAPIVGATAATYSLAATALSDNGAQFQVQVCAAPTRCVTSNAATLTVTQAPVAPAFTLQPSNIGVAAGQTASFTVTATGNPLPRIEWQSAPASDPNNFTAVAGTPGCARTDPPTTGASTTATCSVGPLTVGDSGRRYRAAATNSATTVNSNPATVTVNPVPVAPTITQQPAAQTTTVGGNAVFSVTASGTATLGYTWALNGTNLPSLSGGFNTGTCTGKVTYSNANATITLSELSAGCNGVQVGVTVSNNVNPSAVSNGVLLTVNAVTQGLTLLAGDIGGQGSLDGTGADARVALSPENGIAVDVAGNAYFSDINGKVRRVTPAGVVTTIAGASNPLNNPAGVALDSAGNLFVAERGIGRILRITPAGVLSVWAQQASLSVASRLAIDANDNLYVTSEAGSRDGLISKISPTQVVSHFYTFGSGESIGAIAVAGDGSLYGAGNGALYGTVVRITAAGTLSILAGTPGEAGHVDGIGAAARFNGINGLAFSTSGDLFATDANNAAVRLITLAGVVTTVSGGRSAPFEPTDGAGTAARYDFPGSIGRLPGGDMLIGDVATLRRLSPSPNFFASTFVGKRARFGSTDGVGAAAQLSCSCELALDAAGNAYLAGRVGRNRKVTPTGSVSTLTGTVTGSLSDYSYYIAFDATRGELVQASFFAVWRVTTAGVVTLLAGDPDGQAYVDGTGAAARFYGIKGLTVDAAGNVLVSEGLSNTIRRITPAGVVTTIAGAQDQAGTADGAAAEARFSAPGALAADASGNLFVSDGLTIRRITPTGQVSTVAGSPNELGSVDGIGAAVRFRGVTKLAFEPSGNLLIADGSTLRRMTPGYAVTTVMGVDGERGVKLGASPRLNWIAGLAVRPNGRAVLMSEAAVLEALLP